MPEEPLMVTVHSSHAIAQRKEGLSLADIVDETLILYPNLFKPGFSNKMKDLFSEYGLNLQNLTVVEGFQLALSMVTAGEGILLFQRAPQPCNLNI